MVSQSFSGKRLFTTHSGGHNHGRSRHRHALAAIDMPKCVIRFYSSCPTLNAAVGSQSLNNRAEHDPLIETLKGYGGALSALSDCMAFNSWPAL